MFLRSETTLKYMKVRHSLVYGYSCKYVLFPSCECQHVFFQKKTQPFPTRPWYFVTKRDSIQYPLCIPKLCSLNCHPISDVSVALPAFMPTCFECSEPDFIVMA